MVPGLPILQANALRQRGGSRERKVKLKYNEQWYDFVIKQVQENSETNTFTYTCKDLFVNELGKTGYDVELNVELQNNMGTVTELGKAILNGSTWTVDEVNSDKDIKFFGNDRQINITEITMNGDFEHNDELSSKQ